MYSRNLVLYKADKWTREYYASQLGIELPADEALPSVEKPPPARLPIPKHNGFGSEEDSLGNCRSLMCKGPKRDVKKWMKHADKAWWFCYFFQSVGNQTIVPQKPVAWFRKPSLCATVGAELSR